MSANTTAQALTVSVTMGFSKGKELELQISPHLRGEICNVVRF